MIKIVTRKNDSTTRTVHGSTLDSLRDGISDLRHNDVNLLISAIDNKGIETIILEIFIVKKDNSRDFKLYDGKGILIG